jgi:cation transport ATPase
MFESLEQRRRFGRSPRQILAESIKRWIAAIVIAAVAISSALWFFFAEAAEDIETFVTTFLHAE